jgi:hypothetical protein
MVALLRSADHKLESFRNLRFTAAQLHQYRQNAWNAWSVVVICGAMKTNFILSVVVALSALAWSSVAFCGEIHEAVADGDVAKVEALLKRNPRLIQSADEYGETPLHIAAICGQEDIAKLLLAHHADVNAKDNVGQTPLHIVAREGYVEIAKLLIAHRATVNVKDNEGKTPLHCAARRGNKKIAVLLWVHDAEVDATDKAGDTPLAYALQARQAVPNNQRLPAQIKELLLRGLDETIPFLRSHSAKE